MLVHTFELPVLQMRHCHVIITMEDPVVRHLYVVLDFILGYQMEMEMDL